MTGCDGPDQPPSLDVIVAFPSDTVRFSLPARTHRCTDGRTILLEGMIPEGNGVLVRLHFPDTIVSATYPVVVPDDPTTPGAVVAVRYLLRETPRAFFFDSGAVHVRRERTKISGRADGTGVESGIRTPTHIEYHDVSLPTRPDTVPCNFQR